MSDDFHGYVRVRRTEPLGMVGFRGDLASAAVAAALRDATGCDMPQPRRLTRAGDHMVAWMAPDELLLICPRETAPGLAADLSRALEGQHHLAVDVSDARVTFALDGKALREVLAKLTPADTARLPEGELRRSRLGQVAAAFWLDGPDRARVIVFRSVADYAFLALCHAARPGSEVDPAAPGSEV